MKPTEVALPRRLSHLPRDKRGYPIIATVERGDGEVNFGAIGERRKLALATFDWCGVCGLPFGNELRWEHFVPGMSISSPFFSEAPVHEICAVYSAQVCPFMSSPQARFGDDVRSGRRREPSITFEGFDQTTRLTAFESGLQRGMHVLHFTLKGNSASFSYEKPDELADRYRELLAAEESIRLTSAEQELVALFNGTEDGHVVTGAAVIAGAAYLPNAFKLRALKAFDDGGYKTMAKMTVLDPDVRRDLAVTARDPATRAVAEWLVERGDDIPLLLAEWQRLGRRRHGVVEARPEQPKGPGRAVSKNDPCPCGSGRKARRCHPSGIPVPTP